MGLSITILQPASLTATVNGGAILAAVVGKSATLNIEMGVPGPGATVQVGTTTTGDAGTDASVVNVGTLSAAILDFTIPRGDKGEQGNKGDTGNAAVVNVGTTTTLSAGSSATVTNSGTSSNAVFNFGIPQGIQGQKGDKGDTGSAGSSATVQVGTTTTLSAGSSATVTNSGSTSAAVFNFGIPQGIKGDKGDTGATGAGVATGGTAGQVLAKVDGTNYNTHWIDVTSGGGTWGSITGTLSNQTDLYSALNGKLSLTGGNMTGNIAFVSDGNGDDTAVGSFGLGTENTDGKVAYIEPTQIRIYDNTHLIGTSLNGTGITFNDETVQVTAGLPLTGGTVTGNIVLNTGGDLSNTITERYIYILDTNSANYTYLTNNSIVFHNDSGSANSAIFGAGGFNIGDGLLIGTNSGITFPDSSTQNTAFPPTGGTTSEYIRGDGSLYTFPPVGDRYLTSSTSTLTIDSGNGKTMTVGTGLSYSPQQDITVSYNTANHMHGTVLTYNSTTGVMTWDSNTHSGSGTYSNWEVNVGGVAGAVLPVGGTAGQVLAKINSTNFNTEWVSLGSASTLASSAVLQTANNLSDLSSSSTARTNLGLGSMATQSTSSYLSSSAIASTYQTQSGMSAYLSTSAASSTYLTQSNASSTYLTQSNAASTYIGTSAYATTAQAQAGTSTTTVVSPSTLLDSKYFCGNKVEKAWSVATSGTGSNSTNYGTSRQTTAPSTGAGYAIASTPIIQNKRGTVFNAGIDWSRRVIVGARLCCTNTTTPDANSVFRLTLGKSVASLSAGDFNTRGICAKVTGTNPMQMMVHNGTSLTTVTSSFTPTNNQVFDLQMISDGAGNVTLYINDSSVATTTGGPTSIGGNDLCGFQVECQNTATISNNPYKYTTSESYVQVNL